MRRLLAATAVSALLLAGCGSGADSPSGTSGTSGTGSPSPRSTTSSVPAEAAPLLRSHGLDGKEPTQIVDYLDRMPVEQRPADLMASVRVDELLMSSAGTEVGLDLPKDRFYLSVAPYVTSTHECFYHSLTTCKGELSGKDVQVRITDDKGTVLVDRTQPTFDNGFVGFWLPRDIRGTLRVTYDGKAGETKIATTTDAPTCLTTLQLA